LKPSARWFPATLLAIVMVASLAPDARARKKKEQAPPSPEQVYRLAVEKIRKKRYYAGRTMLQELLPRIPPDDRDLLPRVQLAIADAFFKDRGFLNYGEALNAYRNFLTYYPQHEEAAKAQFMVGMCLFQQSLSPDRDQTTTLKSIAEFRKLESLYPASALVPEARQRIREAEDRLAEHERLVGWFYQKRRGYLAAIDRYRTILRDYPHYSAMDRVLFDLGRCLLAVGNRPDAADAFDRLQRSAPEGKLSKKASELLREYDRKQARRVGKDRKG
jgi:outer membrane protein assembly factor BamD